MLAKNATYLINHHKLISGINTSIKKTFLRRYSVSLIQSCSKPTTRTNKLVIYCNTQITEHGKNGNVQEAESIFQRMPFKTIVSYTAMLCAYAQNGQITKAREMFDEMPQQNVASWNAMITAYMRNGKRSNGIDEAYRLFLRMPERNAVSYAAMITGFVNVGRFDEAKRLYSGTPLNWRDPVCSNVLLNGYLKIGKLEDALHIFEGMVEKDVVSWSSMVDGYCKNGRVSEAREFFDVMEEKRNEVTWCAMISGYFKMERFKDGFNLFLQMRRGGEVGFGPTLVTAIFEACGRLGKFEEGIQMHGLVSHMGFEFDVFLGNSIITMYSRFGCMNAARYIFNTMNRKDLVSWNSLINGYVHAGELEEAYQLFEKMEAKDLVSWTTMITGFSNKGLTKNCVDLFNRMPERDDIAWTALISGFVNNGEHEEAIYLFIQMLRSAVRPNPLTLSGVLSASSDLAILNHGLQVHTHAFKMKMELDLSVQNALISMYSKCGSLDDAYRIFKSISAPNLVSFNSMITGFAHNGYGKEAIQLFRHLENRRLEPNEITFLGVLSACTHVGLVEEGWKYFGSMRAFYKVEPGPDHYACMVDLLGRAGFVDEALHLIKSMPVEPHSGVWGALLGASRAQVRLDIAKIATQHILELEPNNAAPYVVLSDIYSFLGKRRDEEQLRLAKRTKGIKKSPGCSWITVKNNVNLFVSGDRAHINFGEIKITLLAIFYEMKQFHCMDTDWLPP